MLKKTLIALLCFSLIAVCFGFLIKARFTGDRIKAEITAALKNKISREVIINGDLTFSIFPHFRLETTNIIIANANKAKPLPFLSIDKLNIELALSALLAKQLKINDITITGLTIKLTIDSHGNNNWDDLLHPVIPDESNGNSSFTWMQPNSWSIGALVINEAMLFWDDEQSGNSFEIKKLNWDLSEFAPGKSMQNSLSMLVEGKSMPTPGKIDWSGVVEADSRFERWQFSDYKMEFYGFQPVYLLDYLAASLTLPEILLDLKQEIIRIPRLGLTSGEIELTGSDLTVEKLTTKPVVSGLFSVDSFNLKAAAQQWGGRLPELNNAAALTNAGFDFQLQANADSLNIKKLKGKLDQTTFEGTVTLTYAPSLRLGFDLNIDTLVLNDYLPKNSDTNKSTTSASTMMIHLPATPGKEVFALHVNGAIHVNNLNFNGVNAHNMQLKLLSGNTDNIRAVN